MKFFEFISTFLSQTFSFLSPTVMIDLLFERLQKMLKTLIILFICTIMSCVTLAYLIDRFLTQLDAGEFIFSRSIILLVVLLVGLMLTMTIILKTLAQEHAEEKKVQDTKKTESALEAAVAALIMSYVNEREEKRKPETTPSPASPPVGL